MRRALRLTIGTGLVVLGVVLLPLPGPGLLIIFAGLTTLAAHVEWADRLASSIRSRLRRARPQPPRSTPADPGRTSASGEDPIDHAA